MLLGLFTCTHFPGLFTCLEVHTWQRIREIDVFECQLWGENKLAKMSWSWLGSLVPCFVNNNYVIAEFIYSTVHTRHRVLGHEVFTWSRGAHWVTGCSLGHEVLTWSRGAHLVKRCSLGHGVLTWSRGAHLVTGYSLGHGVLTWSRGAHLVMSCFVQYTSKSLTRKALAATALGLHWNGIMVVLREVMSWLYHGCVV